MLCPISLESDNDCVGDGVVSSVFSFYSYVQPTILRFNMALNYLTQIS